MSRLAKKPIIIPEGVSVEISDSKITVSGPKGKLERAFDLMLVKIEKKDNSLNLFLGRQTSQAGMLLGTYASHIKNMIAGVTGGFSKNLIIEGIGYRAQLEGRNLVLSLGYSHPVKMAVPDGIEIKIEKNKIFVSGTDKELVGEAAAKIRACKKPEPYKGKGIRYENEIIRRKSGKKTVAAS